MEKRSISIKGHRTSVALERPFWERLDAIAAARGLSLPKMIADVDRARLSAGKPVGLASALRVFALETPLSGVGNESERGPAEDQLRI